MLTATGRSVRYHGEKADLEYDAMPSQQEKYERFLQLHERAGIFAIPNPWNAGTAKMLTQIGFDALATTSAGLAFSLGCADSSGELSRMQVLANAREIVEATDLPVTADLESGFGEEPEACAMSIQQAVAAGLVGGSIEDAAGRADNPIYPLALAVERIAAACEVARGMPFVLTARAENFLWGRPDLDDTIRRLQAFEAAGADVLYAPGLPDLEAIKTVCASLAKPVNVVIGLKPPFYSLDELQAAGVKRVSVGGALLRTAIAAFHAAASEIKEKGTFMFAANAIPNAVSS